MDSISAFARGAATRGKERKVFDWEKAARLIVERKPSTVRAGLAGDWEYTGGTIYNRHGPVDREATYVYLASTWATPEIEIDDEVEDCYRMESTTPGWDAHTYWPPEALAILNPPEVP